MICDKISYDNYKDAVTAIIAIATKNKKKFKAYKCNDCGTFHITTINKRTLFDIKKAEKYPLKVENGKAEKKTSFGNIGNLQKGKVIPLATEKMLSKDMARLLKGKIEAMNRTNGIK